MNSKPWVPRMRLYMDVKVVWVVFSLPFFIPVVYADDNLFPVFLFIFRNFTFG